MKSKICPHCKTENPEIAVFCKKCGALFRGEPEIKDGLEKKLKTRNTLIIVSCIILLLVAFIIFKAGSAPKQTSATTTTATTASTTLAATTQPTTAAPETTTAATTEATTEKLTLPTLPSTTAVPTTAKPTEPAPTAEEIQAVCDSFNELIYNIKSRDWDITVHRKDTIEMKITDFSIPAPVNTINLFMSRLVPQTDETYNFSDGVAQESASILLADYIPPSSASGSSVSVDNVKSAKIDDKNIYTLTFKADSSTFADGQTQLPPHVSTATNPLDFANFALGNVLVSKAEISYPGTVVKAAVDEDGDLTKLLIKQPAIVKCTGSVGPLTADVVLDISAESYYEITYN